MIQFKGQRKGISEGREREMLLIYSRAIGPSVKLHITMNVLSVWLFCEIFFMMFCPYLSRIRQGRNWKSNQS